MPVIMSLEGPRAGRLAQLRGELYASLPKRWWRATAPLAGFFDPWRISWPFAIIALIGGAWLARSSRGKRIVAAARMRSVK